MSVTSIGDRGWRKPVRDSLMRQHCLQWVGTFTDVANPRNCDRGAD